MAYSSNGTAPRFNCIPREAVIIQNCIFDFTTSRNNLYR